MGLEDKLNIESKGLLTRISDKIKSSLTTKAITYGLAGSLALGTYSCSKGGGGGGKEEISPPTAGIYITKDQPDKVAVDANNNIVSYNKIIIKFVNGTQDSEKDSIINSLNGKVTGYLPQIGYYEITVQTTSVNQIETIINNLSTDPKIEVAEKDYTGKLNATDIETNPDNWDVWGYNMIKLPETYQYLRSKGLYDNTKKDVIIAVIDDAIETEHPELINNLLPSYYFYDVGDNDRDVRPTDIFRENFAVGVEGDGEFQKAKLHGTWVSGIASAESNGKLINGVAYRAQIMPIKIFSSDPKLSEQLFFYFKLAGAILYATDLGANVINMSLGGGLLPGVMPAFLGVPELKKAVEYAHNKGVVLVASAGNDGVDASYFYPSKLLQVISVGATNSSDERWIGSNFSSSNLQSVLSLAAPGQGIRGLDAENYLVWAKASGTSASAPFVSGLAALLKSLNNNLRPSQLEQIMRDTADNISVDYNGDTVADGTWKRINAYNAVLAVVEGRIAFTSLRDDLDGICSPSTGTLDCNYEIYVMNSDGSNQTRLTNNPAYDSYPRGSPDDTKITFDSNRDGNWEIYVMNSDGSNQTNLTNNPASDYNPAWSPDGKKIAFHSNRDGNFEIYVMNSDGSNQTNLTNNPAGDYWSAWSPDGTKIAFESFRDGNSEIYVMNADGSNQVNLTNNLVADHGPDWSPDGTKITFESWIDGNYEIYVMNSDGSNQVRLTNNPAIDGSPDWSHDGTKIAFESNRDGNNEIYVMNADGSNQVNLTNNPAGDGLPDWYP